MGFWEFGVVLVTLSCVFVVPFVALIVLVKVIRGGPSKRDLAVNAQETKMIQEIHHGLAQMEQRVEALETLLLERDRKEGQQ